MAFTLGDEIQFNRLFKHKTQKLMYNWLHILLILILTLRPALLLCKFMRDRSSPSSSLASRNFRAKRIPNATSTLHPDHFHPAGVGSRGRGPVAHPQVEMLPRAHAAVMA